MNQNPPLAPHALAAPARWIASAGGIGRFPVAPGTAASLAALLTGVLVLRLDPRLLPFLILAACLIGTWAIHLSQAEGDPGWIVIDEVAGQWIALMGLAHLTLYGAIAAFVLFRVFDIVKFGPVRWVERWPGAIGVMADDIVAGLIVAVILFVTTNLFPSVLP